MSYFSKMKGTTKSPPRVSSLEILWSFLGAFLGISAVGYINYQMLGGGGNVLMFGPFGASAILIYGAIKSPLAQPRNLICGHNLAALIGVASYKALHPHLWLAASMSVALAVAVMHYTKTLHPPAGAGLIVMLIIALIFNNIPRNRRYPEFWF